MKFSRLPDIDLQEVKLVPHPDQDVDGSFTSFDLVGGVDVYGLLGEGGSCSTILKFGDSLVLMKIRRKYSRNPIELRGTCNMEESAAMDRLYWGV